VQEQREPKQGAPDAGPDVRLAFTLFTAGTRGARRNRGEQGECEAQEDPVDQEDNPEKT